MARLFSLILFVFLYGGLVVSLFVSQEMLPERVATHFNMTGQPDGWMSRTKHLTFMAVFSTVLPLFIIGICWATRFLPVSLVNIPYQDYWLAEPQRTDSVSFLGWHSIWIGCLMEALMIALHWLTVMANHRQPVELPMSWGLGLIVPFLIGVAVWIGVLYRRFGTPPQTGSTTAM